MRLVYQKEFLKGYKKLGQKDKDAVNDALRAFMENPENPKLRNHALKGKLKGYRSIDAGFDLRIHFYEEGDYVAVFLVRVGSHSQLYG